jgi:hypothetical protein
MSSIDDRDNEQWTEDVLDLGLSQEGQDPFPVTLGEGMAEEPVVVDASQVTRDPTENVQENRIAEPAVDDLASVAELASKPKAKRNTVQFANKKLLASLDLFLDPLYKDQFDDPSVLIVGQVKECARESNGRRYRIDWKNDGMPLPGGLQANWLSPYLPGTCRDAIQAAIQRYAECTPPPPRPLAKAGTTQRPKKRAPKATAVQSPVEVVDAIAASASVRTSSTISSLSQSTIASPVPPRVPAASATARGTRATADVESASDDGDDLDEEDNIYVENASDSEDEDAEEDDEDEDTITASVSGSDEGGIGQMLEDILWDFICVATFEDTDAPSPYNGPSGLKPRVAESFKDPFECLGVCGGLDYEFVSRLAANSNEYARKHLVTNDRNSRLHGQPFKTALTKPRQRIYLVA